jgi:hypothetical protein
VERSEWKVEEYDYDVSEVESEGREESEIDHQALITQ